MQNCAKSKTWNNFRKVWAMWRPAPARFSELSRSRGFLIWSLKFLVFSPCSHWSMRPAALWCIGCLHQSSFGTFLLSSPFHQRNHVRLLVAALLKPWRSRTSNGIHQFHADIECCLYQMYLVWSKNPVMSKGLQSGCSYSLLKSQSYQGSCSGCNSLPHPAF